MPISTFLYFRRNLLSISLPADLFANHNINGNICDYLQGCRQDGSGESDSGAGDAFVFFNSIK